jgi:hypothetical protein
LGDCESIIFFSFKKVTHYTIPWLQKNNSDSLKVSYFFQGIKLCLDSISILRYQADASSFNQDKFGSPVSIFKSIVELVQDLSENMERNFTDQTSFIRFEIIVQVLRRGFYLGLPQSKLIMHYSALDLLKAFPRIFLYF